jgi:hypothetical protein
MEWYTLPDPAIDIVFDLATVVCAFDFNLDALLDAESDPESRDFLPLCLGGLALVLDLPLAFSREGCDLRDCRETGRTAVLVEGTASQML